MNREDETNMSHVTREEVECKSCGRIIRKYELQYDSPDGRICSNCYRLKHSIETLRRPVTIEGEKLLGCIRARSGRGSKVLAFTPKRVFVAGFVGGAVFGGGYGEDPVGIAMLAIDALSTLYAQTKSEKLLKANLKEILKADKIDSVIHNSEIREVELEESELEAVRLGIITNKEKGKPSDEIYEKHEWNLTGLIPEKKGVILEDYENILRPIFGDKLSVRTQARRFKKRKDVVAWQLEDQLKGLKEQLSLGHITQEEYEEKKKKLLEKSEE